MKLDLSEIARSIGMHYTYEVDEDDSDLREQGIVLNDRVRGSVQFSNTGQVLLVRGRLRTTVSLECVRCLSTFPSLQEFDVEEQFALHRERKAGRGSEEDNEDPDPDDPDMSDEAMYDEGILDLTELVRQNLLVNIPYAPVCRDDCAGLCPHCGQDLNTGQCSCPGDDDESVASLREALAGLQEDGPDSGPDDPPSGGPA